MQHPGEIEVCPNHGDNLVPLIWTYKFDNYEYWCCKCGYKCGIFDNTGKSVEKPDMALLGLEAKLKSETEEFLNKDGIEWKYENGKIEIS